MVSLVIEAVDASGTNASDQCYNSIFTQNNSTTTTVNIKILDQNDNKPIFKSSFISIGVRRTITTGKTEAFIYDLKASTLDLMRHMILHLVTVAFVLIKSF